MPGGTPSLRPGGLADGGGHPGGDPAVEDAGDDVVGAELVVVHAGGDRPGRGHLHRLRDGVGAGVKGAPEHPREGEHVVDLVGLVAAAGGDHGGVAAGAGRVDLGVGVGQGEHDRVPAHGGDVGRLEDAGAADSDEHVRAGQGVAQRPGEAVGVGVLGHPALALVQPLAALVEHAVAVAGDDLAGPLGLEDLDDGDPGRPRARQHHPDRVQVLADHPQGVGQGGQDDDGRAVLIVVEHRDVERLPQPALDLEAAGGGDVLQVDPTVAGGQQLDRADDLVGVLGGQADRPGVDPGELLEQQGLALHHRQRRMGPDVAEAEHGRAVGDHGHGVALDGELAGVARVGRDRPADPGHPGGVGHRQVVAGAQRHLGGDLELAAQVEQEGPVADGVDVGAVDPADRLGDGVGVAGVDGVAGEVDHQQLRVGLDDVDRHHGARRLADRGGDAADAQRVGTEVHPHGDRVGGAGNAHVSSLNGEASGLRLREPSRALLAWSLWLGTLACLLGGLAVTLAVTRPLTSDTLVNGAVEGAVWLLFATIGLVLTLRRPGNPIGWLYAAAGLAWTLPVPFDPWVDELLLSGRPLPPVARLGALAADTLWAVGITLAITLPLLLLPDGRLRSPRWRLVAAAAIAATAINVIGWGPSSGPMTP